MLYGSCMLLSIVTGCICCLALCREFPYGRSSKRKSTRRRALQVATLLLPRRASPASYVTFFRVRLKSVVVLLIRAAARRCGVDLPHISRVAQG